MPRSPDDLRLTSFHVRIGLVAAGGPFCDGYILGLIGIALPAIVQALHISGFMTGAVGASSLIGVLVGGLAGGLLSDRWGRKKLYTLNILLFVLFSALHCVWTSLSGLLVLRFCLGVAIGADYPIAIAYVTEFMPKKWRGPVLSGLILFWWLGYSASFAVGYVFSLFAPDRWPLIVASGFVPAFVLLIGRAGIPESPRWLMQQGRMEKARHIIDTHLGQDVMFAPDEMQVRKGMGLRDILRSRHRHFLLFVGGFWILQSAPSFAIHTLQAPLLAQFHLTNPLLATAAITALTLVGIGPVAFGLINRMGRRKLLIGTFAINAAALAVIGLWSAAPAGVVLAVFAIFAICDAAGSGLQFVYPGELFPTEIRATAIGFACSLSRVGAALGTLLLPIGYARLGINAVMLIAAGLSLLGMLISWRWAPETRDLSLADAGRIPGAATITGQIRSRSFESGMERSILRAVDK